MRPEQGDDGPGPVGQAMESGNEVSAAYYIRIRGEVSGPFPRGLLLRHRALGRLGARDEVSPDRIAWEPVEQCPAMALPETTHKPCACDEAEAVAWREERRRAQLRWIDERSTDDRRIRERADAADEQRNGSDRRATPAPAIHCFGSDTAPSRPRTRWHLAVVLAALLVACLIGAALRWLAPRQDPRVQLLRHSALESPAGSGSASGVPAPPASRGTA